MFTKQIFVPLISSLDYCLLYISTWKHGKKLGYFEPLSKENAQHILIVHFFTFEHTNRSTYYFAKTTFWLFPLLCCWSKYVRTYIVCILHTYLLCVWDRKSVRPKRTSLIGRGNVTPFALKAFLGVQNFPNRNSQLKKLFTDTCVFILISCPTSTLSM